MFVFDRLPDNESRVGKYEWPDLYDYATELEGIAHLRLEVVKDVTKTMIRMNKIVVTETRVPEKSASASPKKRPLMLSE